MRKIVKIHFCLLSIFTICSCHHKELTSQVQIKKLAYPSASAIEFYEGKLYVTGDDAVNMIVLDTALTTIDSTLLFSYPEKRIPKEMKPDLEASAIDADGNLFLFGSGSSPTRNFGWRHNLNNKNIDSVDLEPLYSRIKDAGVEQLNIEGACYIAGTWILVNRGNKGYQHNQLIIIDNGFLKNNNLLNFRVIPFKAQADTSKFKGISGLAYAKQTDQLILTVSTEDTRNAYDDGTIGKSYLWIINNVSNKLNSNQVSADRIIDLGEIDPRFKGQKIESATITKETSDGIRLVLVADNDDGSSTIFKMSVK